MTPRAGSPDAARRRTASCLDAPSLADAYAGWLLESIGHAQPAHPATETLHPHLEWARSGAMALTGMAAGHPLLAPGPLAACARGALQALQELAGPNHALELDGPALLGERAALAGLRRRGGVSPGGSCRLLRAADGWLGVSLARADDAALLPAWLGEGRVDDPWAFVAARVSSRSAEDVVERARLLGLPAAVAVEPDRDPPPWHRIGARGRPRWRRARAAPLVIDLSALWAGPLCTHLLSLAGARVVKVESTRRPDGARFGPARFYDLLNGGKQSVALDFGAPEGRARLRQLVECADIVVESARPRALLQLGLHAASLVEAVPGLTWVSITGYGRCGPGANWVAFGDDAGVAAGLATATGRAAGRPLFCGDAIADPLAGLHAALAALSSWSRGGGQLVELALRDVVAHVLAFGRPAEPAPVRAQGDAWEVVVGEQRARVASPRSRAPRERARPLGADTEAVLRELGGPC
jgi:hypothetical protein